MTGDTVDDLSELTGFAVPAASAEPMPATGGQGRQEDWQRFISARSQAEPGLYTATWRQRRSSPTALSHSAAQRHC